MPDDKAADPDPVKGPRSVLLVEDEVLLRLAVAEALRQAGFDVIEAGSAREALDVVYSNAPVDVVVADVLLPGALDGLAVARIARIARPSLRVIIASATDASDQARDLADVVFAKPYDVDALAQRVRILAGELK